MFDKMKTYCFGRYLVDVPYEAEIKGQGNTYLSTTIKSERGSELLLRQKIEKRTRELKEGKSASEYFQYNREIKQSDLSYLLLGYQEAYGSPMYSIDSFKQDRGWIFTTSKGPYDDKKIDSIIARFNDYLKNVRYRSDREMPTEAGFCFENGFIANDGKTSQAEIASLAFRMKNNQDVRIRIESTVTSKPWPSLLERLKASKLEERFPGKIKIVREGNLTVNGMPGEESLAHFPSDDKTGEAHDFTWETLGDVGNPLKPDIQLAITSGEGVAGVTGVSSMSTKQIQALYEAIVKTIRLRPTTEAR
ncbi:T6SS immunity protein Tli4 family protein [Crenobacter sp. SG2305]|uniref:T6SS immunity protein Tli4 family protein n=1 Tax=Crenobacter oryzisoli TaxID=3056844 RepID=UPI0025AAAB8C|nr:T6SS immunity protein Tli4 family protein [Crenobacter sp. SG2305]MDN0084584.1 T6SS immunity protein Tli4 family protein [Crenobacter sp. SG2305]